MRTYLILAFILCAFSTSAINIHKFQSFTVEDGLPHTDAKCFYQDSIGYVWIGTNSGLVKFDGYNLQTYFYPKNVDLNRINSIKKLTNQKLILGTEGGFCIFNINTLSFSDFVYGNNSSNITINGEITQLVKTPNNFLFFNYSSNTYIAKLKHDTIDEIRNIKELFKNDIPDYYIYSTYLDPNNNIWFTHEYGALCLTINSYSNYSKIFDYYGSQNPTLRNPVTNCILDLNNDLWLTSYNNLVRIGLENNNGSYSKSYLKKYNYPPVFMKDLQNASSALEPTSMVVDSRNIVWIGSWEGILKIDAKSNINESKIEHITVIPSLRHSLNSNLISSLFITENKNLLIGTWGSGFNIYNTEPSKFNTYIKENQGEINPASFVRSILEDSNKNIWLSIGFNGVYLFDFNMNLKRTISPIGDPAYTISDPRVRGFEEDLNGDIWVSTTYGLNIISPKSFRVTKLYSNDDSLSLASNSIQCLETDLFNRMWCGSWGKGITIISHKNGNFEYKYLNTESHPALLSNKINQILYDKTNNQILVTTNNGLDRIILDAAGNIREGLQYNSSGTFKSNYLWPIQQENDSIFWAGTLGGGLSRIAFKGRAIKTQNFSKEDGAPSNDIEGLLIDKAGNVWTSGMGLSRFNLKTKDFWNFDLFDGLQSNSFKVGASYIGASGRMYFGGIQGMNYFYPEEIAKKPSHHKTLITSILINNETTVTLNNLKIKSDGDSKHPTLNINYSQRNFVISFSILNYFNAPKSKYKYRLINYSDNWQTIENGKHEAIFSNLSPGKYTFEVYGTNTEGTWSKKPAVLDIVVIPPWWLSKLAFGLYFIIILLIFYYTFKSINRFQNLRKDLDQKVLEESTLEELHQTKLRFFTNISHEFRTPLSLIMSPIEKLAASDLPLEERQWYYQIIGKNASRLLRLVNEIVDFRKSETGKIKLRVQKSRLSDFIVPIFDGFKEAALKKEISAHIEYNDNEMLWFDQVQTEKIVYNILSNAIKNTKANGTIEVTINDSPIPEAKFENVYEENEFPKYRRLVYFRVIDSGKGIPKKELPNIFERFYQTVPSSDNSSGIGLALVRSLVQLHQGYLRVSSEPNKGSEFLIAFPVSKNPLNDTETIDSEESSDLHMSTTFTHEIIHEEITEYSSQESLRKRVLVVEDNPEIRHYIAKELSFKYDIITAENGKLGLDLSRDKLPDIIITDVMMPVMDGNEMTRMIKNDIATSHIPIIMLTAKNKLEHEMEGTLAGADTYIRKPFSIRLLELHINNLFTSIERLKKRYGEDALLDATELAHNDRDKQFLQKVDAIICSHLDESEYNLSDLIQEMGMSRTRFYQKIKSVSGMTAKEFFKSVKIKKAVHLLVVKDMSISEVSYMVGFSNISHFSRSFKEMYGMSPSNYKKQYQNKRKQDSTISKAE